MSNINDFIEHYGVKGMKWGVRRERGPDGRVTGKGKKTSRSNKKPSRTTTTYKRSPASLSDKQLRDRITRMELEKKYNELNRPYRPEGRRYAESLLQNAGKTATATIVGSGVSFLVARELKRRFGN